MAKLRILYISILCRIVSIFFSRDTDSIPGIIKITDTLSQISIKLKKYLVFQRHICTSHGESVGKNLTKRNVLALKMV